MKIHSRIYKGPQTDLSMLNKLEYTGGIVSLVLCLGSICTEVQRLWKMNADIVPKCRKKLHTPSNPSRRKYEQ